MTKKKKAVHVFMCDLTDFVDLDAINAPIVLTRCSGVRALMRANLIHRSVQHPT